MVEGGGTAAPETPGAARVSEEIDIIQTNMGSTVLDGMIRRVRGLISASRRREALRALDEVIGTPHLFSEVQRNSKRALVKRCGVPSSPSSWLVGCLRLRSGLRLLLGDCRGGWGDILRAYELGPRHMAEYPEGAESQRGNGSAPRRSSPPPIAAAPDADLIRRLDLALKRSPRLAAAWGWRGLLKRRALDYEGAARDLGRAWSLGLKSSLILTCRGEARLQAGDSEGMKDMETALRGAAQAWNHAWCGRAKMAHERGPGALAYFDRAIALDPENGWYYAWRAEAKRILRKPRGMLEDFDRALELGLIEPNDGYVRAWRGLACLQAGRARAALADFDGALRRIPGYPLALHGRAQACRALGRRKDWLRDLDRAAHFDPKYAHAYSSKPPREIESMLRSLAGMTSASALRWRGLLLSYLGRLPEALRELDRAAARGRRDARAFAWRGRVRMISGDGSGALGDLGRAMRLDKADALAAAWRAELLARLGRSREALKNYGHSLELDQRHSWVYSGRGRLKLSLGDPSGAIRDLEKAVSLDGGDVESLTDLAMIHGAVGNRREKRRLIKRALGADPGRAGQRLKVWENNGSRS